MKRHYHYVDGKVVGTCDGRTFWRFGDDIMRKYNAYGLSCDLIERLHVEGVKWVVVAGQRSALENFTSYGLLASYGGYEPQLFLTMDYWKPATMAKKVQSEQIR